MKTVEWRSLHLTASKKIPGLVFNQRDILQYGLFKVEIAGVQTTTATYTLIKCELLWLEN